MLAVIQRVSKAKVRVDGKVIGKIEHGLLVYVGIAEDDHTKDVDYTARKIAGLRIFDDQTGKLNLSVKDVEGKILLISNFTLQADCRKGNRPGFDKAAPPASADQLFEKLLTKLRHHEIDVETGMFGEHMTIDSISDGPVNIVLDSRVSR